MNKECRNCDASAGDDGVCDECRRDPETNNCSECNRHLEGINYPYVCGVCLKKEWDKKLAGGSSVN